MKSNLKNHSHKEMPIMFLITNTIGSLKTVIVSVVAWLIGSVMGLFFQVGDPPWYWHPVFIAALIPAIFVFSVEILKLLDKKRKDRIEDERQRKLKEESQGEKHLSFSEKTLELTQEERVFLLGKMEDNHQRQIDFYKTLVMFKEIEAFEARLRSHRYGNELNRTHGHVYACHTLMSQKGLEIPEFKLKSGEEIMLGLETEVLAFKQKLERDKESLIHLSDA